MPVNADLPSLLELLACPACRGELESETTKLRCTACGRSFPLEHGVPVLHDGATVVARPSLLGRAHHAVLGNHRVYELQQAYGGGRPIAARVQSQLEHFGGGTLLDVGAGTGMVGGIAPAGTRYVWFDNDPLKLRGLLTKAIDCLAVLGDASRLPFRSDAADWTVMVEVSHHLDDDVLEAAFDEAARVTRGRFLFVDALQSTRLRSKLLWQLDLGRFPRSETEVVRALERRFTLEKVERFRINHDHVLCVCVPS